MKEALIEWKPRAGTTLTLLANAQTVIEEYIALGYQLTLRQLYYQLVARGLLPNQQRWYKKLGKVVTKARMAGLIDWDAIVDRGRVPVKAPDWSDPAAILESAAKQYRLDRWEGQAHHVEVWCEKDALSSVLEPVCNRWHVRFLANRGYSSATAVYDSAKRFRKALNERDQQPVVIYLGDHDPSGNDMSRDVYDRLLVMTFNEGAAVNRLALNMDQIEMYAAPPNPTKITDSRAAAYIAEFGHESWELDALEPQVLDNLVETAILALCDTDLYDEVVEQERKDRAAIRAAAATLKRG